jgi:hypothetical protein
MGQLSPEQAAALGLPQPEAPKRLSPEEAKALGLGEQTPEGKDLFPKIPEVDVKPTEGKPTQYARIAAEAIAPGSHAKLAAEKTDSRAPNDRPVSWDNPYGRLPGQAPRSYRAGYGAIAPEKKKEYEAERDTQYAAHDKAVEENKKAAIGIQAGALLFGPGKVAKTAERAGLQALERLGARGLALGAVNSPRAVTESAARGEDTRTQTGRGLQSFALSTALGLIPGVGNPIAQAILSGAAGAGSERAQRVMEGGIGQLTTEPEKMWEPAATAMALHAINAGARGARKVIRTPGTQRQQDIENYEKAGGQSRFIRGPKPIASAPAEKVTSDAAGATLKENYTSDEGTKGKFIKSEDARMSIVGKSSVQPQTHKSIITDLRDIAGDPHGPPGPRRIAKTWLKQLGPQTKRVNLEVVDEDVSDTVSPNDKTAIGMSLPPEAKKTVNQRAKTINEQGKTIVEKPDIPAPPSDTISAKATTKPVLNLEQIVQMRRQFDEVKGGRFMAKKLRGHLSDNDQDGLAKLYKERAKERKGEELRNRKLGLPKKSSINPEEDPLLRERVAGRLAKVGGENQALTDNVEEAAAASPALKRDLPTVRGVGAQKRLQLFPQLGAASEGRGTYLGRAALPLLYRGDAGLRLLEEELTPPATSSLLIHRRPKKKEPVEVE